MAERSKAVDSSGMLDQDYLGDDNAGNSHYSTLVRGVGSNPTLVIFFFFLALFLLRGSLPAFWFKLNWPVYM